MRHQCWKKNQNLCGGVAGCCVLVGGDKQQRPRIWREGILSSPPWVTCRPHRWVAAAPRFKPAKTIPCSGSSFRGTALWRRRCGPSGTSCESRQPWDWSSCVVSLNPHGPITAEVAVGVLAAVEEGVVGVANVAVEGVAAEGRPQPEPQPEGRRLEPAPRQTRQPPTRPPCRRTTPTTPMLSAKP